MAAVGAWFLGGPVDGRMMAVEVTADGGEAASGWLLVGAQDVRAPAVEHVYVLAEARDGTEIYQYRQPAASEATD